jgi:hypothetical protein
VTRKLFNLADTPAGQGGNDGNGTN